ncbi:MAG: alpha/beta fold hydrolase [Bullifex sp.]|nr:alpha/beta fold hydrolase [Bullifex sp.]
MAVIIVFTLMAMRLINGISRRASIQEASYIDVNGIKQFIRIRGDDGTNPVMIFIHGGPASPMGYVSSFFQKELESKLTIINYDQRVSGRTYYANGCTSDADIETLLADLDSIVDYARTRFAQDKVMITGHSWGTVLGSIYVQRHPEKVITPSVRRAHIGIMR